MKREYEDYLRDMLENAEKALTFVQGLDYDGFCKDDKALYAVIRALEIIGEAARRVSQETRDQYPQIPWREMTSMRNLVIHEYDVVDINQVWDTVQNKIPPLIEELVKIVPPE